MRAKADYIAALERAAEDCVYRHVDMDDLDAACRNRDDAALLRDLAERLGRAQDGWVEHPKPPAGLTQEIWIAEHSKDHGKFARRVWIIDAEEKA